MSVTRPWTAVLYNNSQTKILEVNTSVDSETAQSTINEQNPGWELIAIIPGSHANASYSFSVKRMPTSAGFVDPFDMSHLVK